MRAFSLLIPVILACSSCQPPPDWEIVAERAADRASDGGSGKPRLPDIDTIKTEKRADGLVYEVGKEVPYTGKDVEAEESQDNQDKLRYVVVVPYANGRINGEKQTYFPSGRLREGRLYENGVAIESLVYFSSGKKKIHAKLNARDVAEGEFKRWHENGQLHATGTNDADGKIHGEFKEWDDKGELIGHYLWERGKLKKAIFETPAQKEHRLKSTGKLEGEP